MIQEALKQRNSLEQTLSKKHSLSNYQTIPKLLTKTEYDKLIEDIQLVKFETVKLGEPIILNSVVFPKHNVIFLDKESENLFENYFFVLENICQNLSQLDNSNKLKFEGFFTVMSVFKYMNPELCTNFFGRAYDFMKKYENEMAHILYVMFENMKPAFLNGGLFDIPIADQNDPFNEKTTGCYLYKQ